MNTLKDKNLLPDLRDVVLWVQNPKTGPSIDIGLINLKVKEHSEFYFKLLNLAKKFSFGVEAKVWNPGIYRVRIKKEEK